MFEQLAEGVGPFKYKFHQVAVYTPRFDTAVDSWIDLGYKNWAFDSAVLKGVLNTASLYEEPRWEVCETPARMAFNYDILNGGAEYEILGYQGKLHEWKTKGKDAGEGFISHISVYTEDLEENVKLCEVEWGRTPYHLFTTEQHTNPRVRGRKRFTETIINMKDIFGFDIKFIQKVPWDYKADYSAYTPDWAA